eukprot:COSAG02_NODE_63409_length_263_cov_0.634146_1_plen_71_part_01
MPSQGGYDAVLHGGRLCARGADASRELANNDNDNDNDNVFFFCLAVDPSSPASRDCVCATRTQTASMENCV